MKQLNKAWENTSSAVNYLVENSTAVAQDVALIFRTAYGFETQTTSNATKPLAPAPLNSASPSNNTSSPVVTNDNTDEEKRIAAWNRAAAKHRQARIKAMQNRR